MKLVVVGAEGGAGADKSQKQRRAEDLGVRVISENDFCRMAGLQPPEDLKQQYYGQRDLDSCELLRARNRFASGLLATGLTWAALPWVTGSTAAPAVYFCAIVMIALMAGAAVRWRWRWLEQPVLVEEFVDGREFYVGVLGNANAEALPVRLLLPWLEDDAMTAKAPRPSPRLRLVWCLPAARPARAEVKTWFTERLSRCPARVPRRTRSTSNSNETGS